jgi:hypothetical protein
MRPHFPSWLIALALAPVAAATSALAGCTPSIGDSCALSTDCATDGTRVCDTAEPGGYCTVLNCTGNNLGSTCPDNAFCVLFNPNVPGCPFSAREPGRTGQSECRNSCNTDSDCRASYLCASPLEEPWAGQILDPNQTLKACLPALWFVDGGIGHTNYGYSGPADAVPPVCQAAGPTFDAGFPPLDAPAAPDAGGDASMDGGPRVDGARPKDAAHDGRIDGRTAPKDGGHDATMMHDAGHPSLDAANDTTRPRDATPDAPRDVKRPPDSAGDASKDAPHAPPDAAKDASPAPHDAANG